MRIKFFLLFTLIIACKAADVSLINKFSYKFAKHLELKNENILYSPLSIALATGMLAYGANGDTLNEICNVFDQTDCKTSKSDFHKINKQLLSNYISQAKSSNETESSDERDFQMKINNYEIIDKFFNVKKEYLKNVEETYNSNLIKVDFSTKKVIDEKNLDAKELEMINNLVENAEPLTKMFLVNTIYFKAKWERHFSAEIEGDFYNLDNLEKSKKINFLSRSGAFRCKNFTDHNLTIVEIPYIGNKSFLLLLPNEKNGLPKLKEMIFNETSNLEQLLNELKETRLQLQIPKFAYKVQLNLKSILQKLGMKKVFVNADLTRITDEGGIYVSDAVHKTFINVTKDGTEAGAETVYRISSKSGLVVRKRIKADHPFAFIIRDHENGLNLFNGFVVNL